MKSLLFNQTIETFYWDNTQENVHEWELLKKEVVSCVNYLESSQSLETSHFNKKSRGVRGEVTVNRRQLNFLWKGQNRSDKVYFLNNLIERSAGENNGGEKAEKWWLLNEGRSQHWGNSSSFLTNPLNNLEDELVANKKCGEIRELFNKKDTMWNWLLVPAFFESLLFNNAI